MGFKPPSTRDAEMSRALQRTVDAVQVLVLSWHPFDVGAETADDYSRFRTAIAQLTEAARTVATCLMELRDRPTAGSPRSPSS